MRGISDQQHAPLPEPIGQPAVPANHPPQQVRVAVHPGARRLEGQPQPAFGRERGELRGQRFEHVGQRELARLRGQAAGFQP